MDMDIDIGDQARGIVARMRAIDRAHPTVDRSKVDRALARHLDVLGIPRLPVRWLDDAELGWSAARSARGSKAWSAAHSAVWPASSLLAKSAAWSPAWEAAWSAAWPPGEAAALSALSAAWLPREDTAISATWAVARLASLAAAALSAAQPLDPVIQHYIEIWLPFVDAAEAGLWLFWVTENEVLAVPRPSLQTSGDRLHSETGPAVSWPNGIGYWFWRGVRVPQFVVEEPTRITEEIIDDERNAEVRRIMINRYGPARYAAGGEIIDHDEKWGTLRRRARPDDSDMWMVEVVNSGPEPNGSFRHYHLRIHPEIRPMLPDGSLGEPQQPTALNAVASTFGFTGAKYAQELTAES
jgi:hypothetical protein